VSTLAYLGLGANLNDPIQQIVDARKLLRQLSGTISLRCSSFYISSPVGYQQQDDFINCVIELKTDDAPIQLLDNMQSIENVLGRKRVAGNQNAPRLIDIDLLLFGDQNILTTRLEVPHPRMKSRLFTLKPLLELVEMEYYRCALESSDFEGQTLHRLAIDS
jgi:2-amino-4-hydroxy-6-hydroxymethyldihydropteridine diphosphokinase